MKPRPDIERDLARLADGTLPAARARELEARVTKSAELRELLAEQRRALEAVDMLDDPAPTALRAQIDSMPRPAKVALRGRRLVVSGAIAAAAAAVAIALVAILPSGTAGPTLSEAAAFSLKAPVGPAPAHSFDGTLNLDIDGVPYPYWKDSFGWKAVGTRVDKVADRTATTVFYRKDGARIGYTIVTGAPVSLSGNLAVAMRRGIRFHIATVRGAAVVTWERKDHSCILAGRGLSSDQLIALAAWTDRGALPDAGDG